MADTISGQITVTTAGTAVQGTDVASDGFIVKALATNTSSMYIGNDGADDVSSSSGFELSPGDQVIVDIRNLNKLWVDSAVDGEKVCWLAISPIQV